MPYTCIRVKKIPDLNNCDALRVMGGPVDVWNVVEHPWLDADKAAIKTWGKQVQDLFSGL